MLSRVAQKYVAVFMKRSTKAADPNTGKSISLRYHATAQDAARAYDTYILAHYPSGASTNVSLGLLSDALINV